MPFSLNSNFCLSEKWSSYWWRNVNWLRRKFSRRRRTLWRQTRVGWFPRRNSFSQWRWPLIQASCDSRQPSLRDISIHLRKHKTKWWSSKSFDHKHLSHSHHVHCCLQDVFLAESLFRVFDEDKSGALNFYEFLQVGLDQIRSVQTRSDQAQIQ